MAATETPDNAAKAAEAAQAKGKPDIIPLVAVVVLVPALCFLMMDFVVIPRLKESLKPATSDEAAPFKAGEAKADSGHGGGHKEAPKKEAKESKHGGKEHGKEGGKSAKGADNTIEFGSIVVNLAGSGGNRYLKVNFVVAGNDSNLEDMIKENQNALRDVAISVLSAQSMSSLEAQGGRNLIRSELISQFNRTLGGRPIEQLYFSEFVIQ
jgi:flagellar basal body-associated protein FliL